MLKRMLLLLLLIANWPMANALANDSAVVGSIASVDPVYVDMVRTWNDAWKENLRNRLTGRESPLDSETEFTVERFLKAHEFRSWWELQSRMQPFLEVKRDAAPARVKVINDPHVAIKTKLLALREAKYTIDIAYYIVRNDETGYAIMNELKEALKRGVSIRFLVDSAGTLGMTPHSPLRALIEYAKTNAGYSLDLNGNRTTHRAEIEIVSFNAMSTIFLSPFRFVFRNVYNLFARAAGAQQMASREFSANRRSHDKILLIDGAFEDRAIVFIGGRNIANEYYGVPQVDDHTYVDFEMVARGLKISGSENSASLGAQVSEYFDQIYYHLGNKEIMRSVLGLVWGYSGEIKKMEAASGKLDEMLGLENDQLAIVRKDLIEDGWSENKADIIYSFNNIFRTRASRDIEASEHKLAVKNAKSLMTKLEELIAREDQEVVLISPYIWMSEKQLRLIKTWLRRDPKRKLTIVCNSIMTSDNILAQTLVDNVLGPSLMLDNSVIRSNGVIIRRSIADQVKIYQYGHLDSTDLGGTKPYGKLHAKGVILKGSGVSVFTTSNNDPRSLLLNSEGAIVIYDNKNISDKDANSNQLVSRKFAADVDVIISQSHLWGGDEFNQIRHHPMLPKMKREAVLHTERLYSILIHLNLWWLI